MSLATRCPACGTVFRVVQDQLKVSEGWVRCGRCSEVFNAVESLFDLEQEAPPPWQGAVADAAPGPSYPDASAAASRIVPVPTHEDGGPSRRGGVAAPVSPVDPPAARAAEDLPVDQPAVRAPDESPRWSAKDDDDPEPAIPMGSVFTARHDEPPSASVPSQPISAAAPAATTAAATAFERREPSLQEPPADVAPPPRFIVQADRERKARSPTARIALSLVALVLTLLALGQMAYGSRDLIAAHWPPARAALDPMCEVLGCSVEPLRRIQGLTVDGSGLAKLETGTLYRLTLLLHNRDTVALRLPALDLTLTDAQGVVVARKVLDAAALGASQPAIAAGTELPLQAVLDPGNRRVVGYTIDIFYP